MSDIKDVQAIYSFMKVKGIGVNRTNKALYDYECQLQSIWKQTLEEWLLNVLSEDQRHDYYSQYKQIEDLKFNKFDIHFNMVLEKTYPVSLKKMLNLNAPPVLSMIGNIDLLKTKKVGFSGSRKVSDKGIAVTRDCVEQLAKIPYVSIVSGYAQGVDKEAHYTALKEGGNTIIVLPNGIKDFHMRRELQKVWDWNHVLVISEYLPDDKWTVSRAMNRNQTIIGLSDVMVVVEAGLTGGSLDAGQKTLADGKPLFVPQYAEYPESALGNKILLNQGAQSILRNKQRLCANVDFFYKYIDV